ncbi:helix-turn-helix domain-containing protein [Candidatus Woesearchaeota archaeon]|nr:helix-turn-helix domain-containing protein [Candidatus Woesearchaeota archaeon]MCF7901695.1 helix-turn-helix domain-containing protein [Candidatus Woesearchaeota archaeon]MCF8013269.1 helix-turn-helix domain-containing protein [Candidatus Woesearchaeota archaeon]
MEKKEILENLFDKKIIKVLKLFINNPSEDYYLREIAKLTRVAPASVHRILKTLMSADIIREEKNKHLKTYWFNSNNSKFLIDLLEDKTSAIQEFTQFISSVSGVQMAVMHGREEKDKASILIMGDELDKDSIREKVVDIKQRYKFNIIYLVLLPDQYEQMVSMGLYPGQKKILYRKNN